MVSFSAHFSRSALYAIKWLISRGFLDEFFAWDPKDHYYDRFVNISTANIKIVIGAHCQFIKRTPKHQTLHRQFHGKKEISHWMGCKMMKIIGFLTNQNVHMCQYLKDQKQYQFHAVANNDIFIWKMTSFSLHFSYKSWCCFDTSNHKPIFKQRFMLCLVWSLECGRSFADCPFISFRFVSFSNIVICLALLYY